MSVFLIAAIALGASIGSDRGFNARPLGVCEVLADLLSYRNKMIVVRGQLLRSEEGSYLGGGRCAKPLITAGYRWPDTVPISLLYPDSKLAENQPKTRSVSIDPKSARLLEQSAGDSSASIWATVIGRLETRDHFEIVLRGDGKRVPNGYGHMNASPAQLVYTEMRDVVVMRERTR